VAPVIPLLLAGVLLVMGLSEGLFDVGKRCWCGCMVKKWVHL
jgi:hypothetical protein